MAGPYSNDQDTASAAIPVRLSNGAAFYEGSSPYQGTPLGYQQIVGLVASTALTVPAGATYAVITPESQAVRWRDDGTAPTATVGYPLAVGSELLYSASLSAIRFIQQAATATLNISYYK